MSEISRGPGWSRKSAGKKIAEWTAGLAAATGVLAGAEKMRGAIDRDLVSDRSVPGLAKQPDAVSFPPVAEEIKKVIDVRMNPERINAMSEDRPNVQAPPPPDFDFPNPEVWSPQTPQEAVAYRQLSKVVFERFDKSNLAIIKTADPKYPQEGREAWFSFGHDGGGVNVRILSDGSFLMKRSGDLDNDVVVEAGELNRLLEDKLALSRSYLQFRNGQISEETLMLQVKRLGLPARQSLDGTSVEVP